MIHFPGPFVQKGGGGLGPLGPLSYGPGERTNVKARSQWAFVYMYAIAFVFTIFPLMFGAAHCE